MKTKATFNPVTRTAMPTANLTVDFTNPTGDAIRALHGMNSGPCNTSFVYDARAQFVEAGIPVVRLHDIEYPYGSGEYVDIPCLFKNVDADENDPTNYNFALTDEYIRQSLSVGAKIIYRLGVSIEHSPIKLYTYPPKDYGKWARICEHIIRHYNEGWADGHHWNIEYWEIWNESDAESTKTWAGTQQQFIDFYTVVASHLKKCFPAQKIGGCGFTSSHPQNVAHFLTNIAKNRVPLDFFSFHTYSATPDRPVELWQHFRSLLRENGYADAEILLDEWNYMGSWDTINQPLYYPAMKDHRGAAYYAAMLCAMQRDTDIAIATYFEAAPSKEFCGIFNVKEMRVSIRNGATMEPTKGFYAFKCFDSLYRMGSEVAVQGEAAGLQAIAATGACGSGVLIANQEIEPVSLTLALSGVKTDLVVRLTDPLRTNEIIHSVLAEKSNTVTLILPAQSFVYVGTDLPDPVPAYDKHCFYGVSSAAPAEQINDIFE
ncbi:MAG: hypothetical protein IJY50_08710 [Clostridia bacterium]|nr:hypothetical protein [Clostridia bacterium]